MPGPWTADENSVVTADGQFLLFGGSAPVVTADGWYPGTGPIIVMPNLVGLLQLDAEAVIYKVGCLLTRVSENSSPTQPYLQVMAQSPAAAALVAPQTFVQIVVSLGPFVPSPPIVPIVPEF